MKPNGYQITEPIPGFEAGAILNVTEQFRYAHRNEMKLELISGSPGSTTIVVTDDPVGFGERDVLDETARLGDWHTYARTFDAGGDVFADATASDGLVRLNSETLTTIADPINA